MRTLTMKWKRLSILLILLGSIAFVGCGDEDHDEHAGHDDDTKHAEPADGANAQEDAVHLTAEEMAAFGVEVDTADPRTLAVEISLSGEVVVDPNRLAHIVPRVPGVVRKVIKRQGDHVQAGELMAVLESRDLAEMKAGYLASRERLDMMKVTFAREERLWKQEISSDREYLEARQNLLEAEITTREIEQQLHALGFSDAVLASLTSQSDASFSRYESRAPFDGTVIEKHITLGELLDEEDEAFVIADLSRVWVNLTVYQKDLPFVQIGQPVQVALRESGQSGRGTVFYLSATIDEATRAATARIELDNADGSWRPGLFVTGALAVGGVPVNVAVAKSALQTVEGRKAIFVRTEDGFEARGVTAGREDGTHVEVLEGIQAGEPYASKGAFVLKSQLEKGAIGDGHNH